MNVRRRYLAAAIVAVVGAAIALTTQVSRAGEVRVAPTPPQTGRPTAGRTVTLITGDEVTVLDGDRFSIQRGKGRETMGFTSSVRRGHLSVVPLDAIPLLHSGRLDARLFDVTGLLALHYTSGSDTKLIVAPSSTSRSAVKPAPPAGIHVDRDLPAVRGLAGRVKHGDLGAMWLDIQGRGAGAPKLWLDGMRHLTLDKSVPQIGAPQAWQAGFDGTGVTVAVLDSGIDAAHPDLAGKVVAEHNFVAEYEDALDHVGHGTHVASIIAGTGAASGGTLKGVAPGAKLLDGKICLDGGCPDSAILAGMQWAAADQHARIVNLSVGGTDSPGVDPLEQAVNDLSAQYGTLFVIAAGNDGADRTVESPGSADAALAVGAIDDNDQLAGFSSRGPRDDDSALKPDLTAPGVNINAALSKDSGGPAGQQYVEHSGTSMATPHVAGAAAILVQHSPTLTGPALKATLMGSAVPNSSAGAFAQGSGRVDVPRALATTLTTSPPSVSFGKQQWPHTDDTPVAKTFTYHNGGTAAITVNLAVHADNAGMFTLSASTLSIPAGGDADVSLTADTRTGPDGLIGGYVVATAGNATTHTAFAVDKEVESYDLTIEHFASTGQRPLFSQDQLINVDNNNWYVFYDESGTLQLRLPRGRYSFDSIIVQPDPDNPDQYRVTDLQQPVIDLTKTTTVNADARTAKPVSVKIPNPTAKQYTATLATRVGAGPSDPFTFGFSVGSFERLFVGEIGTSRLDGFVQMLSGEWLQPNADGTFADSPYTYSLIWTQHGRPFAGLNRVVRDRDLAAVARTYLAQLPGSTGQVVLTSKTRDIGFGTYSVPIHPPFTRTEYVTTTSGTMYDVAIGESSDGARTWVDQQNLAYRAEQHPHETLNKAPFGPAADLNPEDGLSQSRFGDNIFIAPYLFSPTGTNTTGGSSAEGSLRLYRDGVLVGEGLASDGFLGVSVPPAQGRYRFEATADRTANFALSTKVIATWEFTSAHTPDLPGTPLPLSAVLFAPNLTDDGTAPAGRPFVVPVSVQSAVPTSRNTSLTVEVSYDDGATWKAASMTSAGAMLNHPSGPGFVSLRAKATDNAGNTVEQTIIRAYRIA